MLLELSVHDLATIEDVRVELFDGFCAWTGETGAGKSLLLGALGLLLGDRGSPELIRAGSDELRVTAVFAMARPQLRRAVEAILDRPIDERLIVSRRLIRQGGSKCYIDDEPVSVQLLKKLGEVLVDIHGQRESHSLLEPSYQTQLLDAFGKLEDLRADYERQANCVRELRQRRLALGADRDAREKELALIRFEREELVSAQLKTNEFAALIQERERLIHAQSMQEYTSQVANQLYDNDGSIVEALGRLHKDAASFIKIDATIADLAKRLDTVSTELRDLADIARDCAEQFEADPERLDEVEKRLKMLKRLETKYKQSVEQLIQYRDQLDAREQALTGASQSLETIDAELEKEFHELLKIANKLSMARTKIGKKLIAETQKHLTKLGMPKAELDVQLIAVSPRDALNDPIPVGGVDQVEFMLCANPGEPMRILRKIASGGELSRTMLALKTVLAAHDPVGTMIFDEIDANVGGRLGDIVGEKLASLGQTHQVICVTHLPQVAVFAKNQWTIRKAIKKNRTTTTITYLESDEARIEELATMMRGESKSETTRQEAIEMLKAARKSARVPK